MPINEKGELVRDHLSGEEREKSPEEILEEYYSGMGIENVPYPGMVKPEGVKFWKPERLELVKDGLATMKRMAQELNIASFVNPYTGEERNLPQWFTMIEQSVAYSEDIARKVASGEIKTIDTRSEEDLAAVRRKLREELLNKQDV